MSSLSSSSSRVFPSPASSGPIMARRQRLKEDVETVSFIYNLPESTIKGAPVPSPFPPQPFPPLLFFFSSTFYDLSIILAPLAVRWPSFLLSPFFPSPSPLCPRLALPLLALPSFDRFNPPYSELSPIRPSLPESVAGGPFFETQGNFQLLFFLPFAPVRFFSPLSPRPSSSFLA